MSRCQSNAARRTILVPFAFIVWTQIGCNNPQVGIPTPPPIQSYQQAWGAAHSLQTEYAQGYAAIGFSPAIFTIPDRPFIAERTYNEWTRTAPQGTPPTVTSTYVIARDSAGRIHYASSRRAGEEDVTISDPVAHLHYRYSITRRPGADLRAEQCSEPLLRGFTGPQTGITPVRDQPSLRAAHYEPAMYFGQPTPQEGRQELGTRTFEGFLAYGQENVHRTSSQYGVKTLREEYWFSPELGISLLEIKDFEGQNEFNIETHRILLTEPDPSLFQLPPGYAVTGEIRSCTGSRR